MSQPLSVVGTEWIVLIVVAIILLFGAKKIPEMARALGRSKSEFEKGKREAEREVAAADVSGERKRLEKIAGELGIDAAGKTDEELKEAVRKTLGEQKPAK